MPRLVRKLLEKVTNHKLRHQPSGYGFAISDRIEGIDPQEAAPGDSVSVTGRAPRIPCSSCTHSITALSVFGATTLDWPSSVEISGERRHCQIVLMPYVYACFSRRFWLRRLPDS